MVICLDKRGPVNYTMSLKMGCFVVVCLAFLVLFFVVYGLLFLGSMVLGF